MNYYETLGITENASGEAIRTAYRRLVRLYHPDISGSGSAEKFRRIQEAYETLGESSRRQAYDLSFHNRRYRIPVTVIHSTDSSVYAEPLAGPSRVPHGNAFIEFDQLFSQFIRWFEANY